MVTWRKSATLSALMIACTLIGFYLSPLRMEIRDCAIAVDTTKQQPTMGSNSVRHISHFSHMYGWRAIGHTWDEQNRLRKMSLVVADWPFYAEDNVPTVPCLSADGHLLIVSAGASRIRYGTSVTFIMVYPTDVKAVLPRNNSAKPRSAHGLSLWCIFDDGSVTPAYSYDSGYGNDRASLLDCPASPFASDQLWRYHRTLRVYLASMTDKQHNLTIAKAYVAVPAPPPSSPLNHSHQLLTLCTSPLHNKAEYVTEWILFHFLVGFRKFVVYNTTDSHAHLEHVIQVINQRYPNLVDVVPWNFSSLALTNVLAGRYFQVEAAHDCFIRYGDQSEWLGMLDLDEYIVPMPPYPTVLEFLHEHFARRSIGSVNLWSQFFCSEANDTYTMDERNPNHLVMERFTFRAPELFRKGREKYLYRPRFVQYLSIHHQVMGLPKQTPSRSSITLAHYISMTELRNMEGCGAEQYVHDTGIRDRFAQRVKMAIQTLAH